MGKMCGFQFFFFFIIDPKIYVLFLRTPGSVLLFGINAFSYTYIMGERGACVS